MRQSILISEIKIPPRMRQEMGNLDGLKDSISRHGLVHPIALSPDNTLVAGERRLRAHQQLGLASIDFCYVKDLPEDERKELEFEENYWRKAMTWQEEAMGILDIYRKKKRLGALKGFEENWHMTIGEMFGIAIGTVNYILKVGKRLEQELTLPEEKRRIWKFGSINEAYRLGLLAEEEDYHAQQLAKQSQQVTNTKAQELHVKQLVSEVTAVAASPDLLAEARKKYEANPLNVVPFDQYWKERLQQVDEAKNTLYLSNRVIHGNCIALMNNPEFMAQFGKFDHIITDPPYAIDMDNLNQQNQQGGLKDLDRVIEAHQVDENLDLLAKFFPAAWNCTKDNAFVIVCADMMVWQYLYDLATKAGFAVQRWPFIWRKINQSIMNNCPGYNTTKDYEIAMICRKPSSTLAKKWNTSFQEASNVEAVKLTGHPFAKPFELTKAFLEAVSTEGQTILEPFAGGGSMAIQMLRSKRNFVAIEKEEHHYNALLENLKREYLKLNPRFLFK